MLLSKISDDTIAEDICLVWKRRKRRGFCREFGGHSWAVNSLWAAAAVRGMERLFLGGLFEETSEVAETLGDGALFEKL